MRLILCVATLLLAGASAALACPGCPTDLGFTVTEEIAGADIALVVEWVAATPADVDQGLPGETEFRVVHVLRDTTGAIAAGDQVEVPRHRAPMNHDRFLLFGLADGMLRWSSPLPVSDAATGYVRALPARDADPRERLRYFARCFEHQDSYVSNDAFAEFAAARYEDVVAVSDEFEAAQLRRWLADEATLPMRMGLYGMLLGLRGDEDDARFLEEWILKPVDDLRLGLEGMISGYLMLTGEDGLAVIEDNKLRNPEANFSETYAAMHSLRFIWSYTEGVIPPERLRSAMRILLDRPELTDIVITDLARWQDWSIVDRLMDMYGAEEYNIPSIKRAIVRYLLVARRSEGPHVPHVQAHLARLRQSDPDTVQEAERIYLLY